MPETNQTQTRTTNLPNITALRQQHIRTRKDLGNLENKTFEPSSFKYLFLGLVAIIGDSVDWLSLTGFGYIVSIFVDIIVGIILIFGGMSAKAQIQRKKEMVANLQKSVEQMMRRVTRIRRYYAKGLKFARKIPRLGKVALALRKARIVVTRSPVMKTLIAVGFDFIPLWELAPWRTFGVWLTYRDEKKAYEEAIAQIKETQLQATDIANE